MPAHLYYRDLQPFFKTSAPTLRKKIQKLGIRTKLHEKSKYIEQEDSAPLFQAYNTSYENFQKFFSEKKDVNEKEGSKSSENRATQEREKGSVAVKTAFTENNEKTFNENTDNQGSEAQENPSNKGQTAFNENFAVKILESQISELKEEKKELKEELKQEREKKETLLTDNGKLEERADTYRNKFIDAQKLIPAPKPTEIRQETGNVLKSWKFWVGVLVPIFSLILLALLYR